MQVVHTCTYPKKESKRKQQEVIMSNFFLFNIIFSIYGQKIISMKVPSSASAHAVWGENIIPCLPCPAPCSSPELGILGAVGHGRAGNHHCSPPSLLCCLLCTQACGQSCTPWELSRERGKLLTPPVSPLLPLLSATWEKEQQAQQGSPGTQGFPRNSSRERGWKACKDWWEEMGYCIAETDRSSIIRTLWSL